jgi:hypothetical protein
MNISFYFKFLVYLSDLFSKTISGIECFDVIQMNFFNPRYHIGMKVNHLLKYMLIRRFYIVRALAITKFTRFHSRFFWTRKQSEASDY